MGLMDILNGMQNGPRGQRQPAPAGQSGGMSPMMMALLGLLAYKAIKGGGLGNILGGGSSSPSPTPPSGRLPGNTQADASGGGGLGDLLGGMLGGGAAPRGGAPGAGGGLGDLLGGMLGGGAGPRGGAPNAGGGLGGLLGGLLGGAAAGGVLNGGLRNLMQDMEQNGQGDVAQSWIGRGQNRDIAPGDLASALGADTINELAGETGMSRDDLLAGLSQQLPQFVDQLTPDGRLPSDDEASRWV